MKIISNKLYKAQGTVKHLPIFMSKIKINDFVNHKYQPYIIYFLRMASMEGNFFKPNSIKMLFLLHYYLNEVYVIYFFLQVYMKSEKIILT